MAKEKRGMSFGVIGLGRFGSTLAQKLGEAGYTVLAIDASEQKIRDARTYTDAAFVVETLDQQSLMEVGIQHCDTVVVCIGERIDTSILTTLIVKQLGVRRVIAKAFSKDQGIVLEKIGAEVIYPESDMAMRLAKRLTNPRVLDFFHLSADVEISEMQLNDRLGGQTLADSRFRNRFNLTVIAVITEAGDTLTDIRPDYRLQANDIIVVIGSKENIERLEQYLSR